MKKRYFETIRTGLLLCSMIGGIASTASAQDLSIVPVTWDIVGLDSNRPATDGPRRFMIGARVTNNSMTTTVDNLSSTFAFTSTVNAANFVLGTDPIITFPSLAPGESVDFYYNVDLVPPSPNPKNIFDRSRPYQITVTADSQAPVSTPAGRALYAEKLVSQNRNDVTSLTGPRSVFVGQTYRYVLTTATSPGGFEQLVATIDFPNTLFQIRNIDVVYENPTGLTGNRVYANACGWDPNPASPTYNSCIGPTILPGEDKVGGIIVSTFDVEIIDTTAPTITVIPVIYDFSGSSFHYNTDFGDEALIVANLDPDIGGRIYRDLDADGVFEPEIGEVGFTGATVRYFSPGPDTMLNTSDDVLEGTTSTDSDGVFQFVTVPDGNYYVTVDGSTGGLPGNQVVSGAMDHIISLPNVATKQGGGSGGNINNLDAGLNNFPLLATVDSFTVSRDKSNTAFVLDWVTSEEIANVGFNLYTAEINEVGSWQKGSKINKSMIFSRAGELGNGASYSYTTSIGFEKALIDYAFYLEDVDFNGVTTLHGPAIWSTKSVDAGFESWKSFEY